MSTAIKTLCIVLLSGAIVANSGCKKDETTPAEMLVGKWNITSAELLGQVAPGDGSWVSFNTCGSCSGSSYMASDGTTGSLTYDLNDEATQIVITDTDTTGGNYDATWDILELTETDFRITATTIFGNLKYEMKKAP